MDVRSDISAFKKTSKEQMNLRSLTPLEEKKIKRKMNEDKALLKLHPSINDYNFTEDINPVKISANLKTKLLSFQYFGVCWMVMREQSVTKGGILADEMGLGKTLQAIGLILSTECRKTLIITPSIALNQWIAEIENHTENINVIKYYGAKADLKDLKDDSIVLTTYGKIEADYRRKSTLFNHSFYRVVIDEAHNIKDFRSSTCAAIQKLSAEKRWGLTGTPVQNRVGDLYSLVKYLQLDPHGLYFCKKCTCKSRIWPNSSSTNFSGYCPCGHFSTQHFSWWNRNITTPIKEFGYTELSAEIFEKMNTITKSIVLRRTKIELEEELSLPSKVTVTDRCYFTDGEADFYQSLYSSTKREFDTYAAKGEVKHNYINIFALLLKMRMAANHPYLAIKTNYNPICGYCNEEVDDPIISECKHVFCREEAKVFILENTRCPVCKVKLTIDFNQNYAPNNLFSMINVRDWHSSTKIERLLEHLQNDNPHFTAKNIIFSQFVNFLEILRWRLERAGFRCVKIYGNMNINQRKVAQEVFNTDPNITIFLISLKAGGVALNLTSATRVFIMDPWWNPAVEEQAMDRIHRIGQHRVIRIIKIIIQDSIESRILELQKKKKALVDSAIDNDHKALGNLSEEDLNFLFL